MESRFFLSLLFSVLIINSYSFNNTTTCWCGTHATGLISYTVQGENADCCQSLAVGTSLTLNYTQQENGVWKNTSVSTGTAANAQKECCPYR